MFPGYGEPESYGLTCRSRAKEKVGNSNHSEGADRI